MFIVHRFDCGDEKMKRTRQWDEVGIHSRIGLSKEGCMVGSDDVEGRALDNPEELALEVRDSVNFDDRVEAKDCSVA